MERCSQVPFSTLDLPTLVKHENAKEMTPT
jgi:hypothetical protein